MLDKTVVIRNKLGLHARAAVKFVNLANRYRCEITVEKDGETVEAKSILGLLLLAAAQGSQLVIRCAGDGEDEAIAALVGLVNDKFGEGE